MKDRNIIIAVLLVIIILLGLQQYAIRINPPDDIEGRLELIETKIDSISNIRDSLLIIVDTTKVKIIELERTHEKIRDSIIVQSVDDDCILFSKYISEYNNRLTNTNNP